MNKSTFTEDINNFKAQSFNWKLVQDEMKKRLQQLRCTTRKLVENTSPDGRRFHSDS